MTTLGTPYLAIMRYLKAFFRDSAVALCSGTNSLYMENRSFSTSSIWLPCFERGRGPTKSAHTLAHGSVGFCVSILFGLNLMHVSHPRTWARASLCIPDLNNTGLPDVLLWIVVLLQHRFPYSCRDADLPSCDILAARFMRYSLIGCHPPSRSLGTFAAGSLSFPESSCLLLKIPPPMSPWSLEAFLVVAALTKRLPPRWVILSCTLFWSRTAATPVPIWWSSLKGFLCCWATSESCGRLLLSFSDRPDDCKALLLGRWVIFLSAVERSAFRLVQFPRPRLLVY